MILSNKNTIGVLVLSVLCMISYFVGNCTRDRVREYGIWYLYRVDDLMKLIKNNIKTPPLSSSISKYKNDFKRKKGIIIFSSCDWEDATGHIDLFDGTIVEGQEYSMCGNVLLYEIS